MPSGSLESFNLFSKLPILSTFIFPLTSGVYQGKPPAYISLRYTIGMLPDPAARAPAF